MDLSDSSSSCEDEDGVCGEWGGGVFVMCMCVCGGGCVLSYIQVTLTFI